MGYGIVNIDEIIKFLSKEMTVKDMHYINLSKTLLENFHTNPTDILNANLSTVKTIHDYIQDRYKVDIDYLGIDLGTKTFMTCSDKNMNHTYTLNSGKIEKAVEKYQHKVKMNENEKADAKTKLLKQIEEPISLCIKELNKKYTSNITYVVGLPHKNTATEEFYEVVTEVITLFRKYKKKYGYNIFYVYEHNTSITCPRCYKQSKKFRKSNNKFVCGNCGFKHENDHEVAACNIVNRYLNQKI